MTVDTVIDRLGEAGVAPGAGRDILLLWGDTAFDAPGPDRIRRSSRYRWPAIGRIGARPAIQFTGPGADTVRVDGTRIAELDPLDRVAALRAAAARGTVDWLVAGSGAEYGVYALTSIEETRTGLHADGTPRKTAYSVEFTRAPDAPSGRLDGLERAVGRHGDPRAVLKAGTDAQARGDGVQDTLDAMAGAGGALDGGAAPADTERMLAAARAAALSDARSSSAESVTAAIEAAREAAARSPAEKAVEALGDVARVALRAKAGDVLDDICWRRYGTLDVLDGLVRANPGLAALGASLLAGTLVELPGRADLTSKAREALVRLWD